MKKITQIFLFALTLSLSFYACDTKKDPTPVVPVATGFTAAQVAGAWKLNTAAASVAGGAINIPDIFDPNSAAASNADGRAAFCTKNSVLTLKADGTFTEDFAAATYTFAGTPPQVQTCPASSVAGTFAIPASSSLLTLTYTGGTPPALRFTLKTVTSTNMNVEISSNAGGVSSITTVTYLKQ